MNNDGGRLNFGVGLDNSALREGAAEARNILSGISDTAQAEGDRMDSMFRKLRNAAAGLFAADQLKEFVSQIATVRGEFQKLEIAFETMLGSKERADALMQQLIHTAATTPFQMSDVANSAKQLLAFGVAAENVNSTLIKLGDLAAGLSIPINDLAYLYGTTMTQGRLYTQDFNQFLGRGIPLADELAKQFKVTKAEVKSLVEEGKVGFPQVEAAINSLAGEGGKFGGLMEAQSKTISGQMSNIEDAIEQMFNEIGRSSQDTISEALGAVSSLIDKWREIGGVLITAASAVGIYKASLMAAAAIQKITAVNTRVNNMLLREAVVQKKLAAMQGIALSKAEALAAARTMSLSRALHSLKAAIASNPIGLLLTAITTAIGLFMTFGNEVDEATERSTRFGEASAKVQSNVNGLYAVLETAEKSSKAYSTAQEELIKLAEEYGLTLDNEQSTHEQLIDKKQELISLMKEEAIERAKANGIDNAYTAYAEEVQKAAEEMKEAISGQFSNEEGGQLAQLITEKDVQRHKQLLGRMVEETNKAVRGEANEKAKARAALEAYYDEVEERGAQYAKLMGKNVSAQQVARDAMREYADAMLVAQQHLNIKTDAENKAATAAKKVAREMDGLTDAERRRANQLRMSKKSVDELSNHIKQLIDTYNNEHINIRITYEEVNPPSWMDGISSNDAKKYAAYYQSLADDMANHQQQTGRTKVYTVNGQTFNQRDAQKRAAQYANHAKVKAKEEEEETAERRKKEEEEKKEAERVAKKEASERKQREEETAKKKTQIEKANHDLLQAGKEAALEAEKAEIDAEKDGMAKSKRLADFRLKEKLAEIEKQKQAEIEKIRALELLKWEAEHPKRPEAEVNAARDNIANTIGEGHLSDEQKKRFQARTDLAIEEHRREIREIETAEAIAMDDYLSRYGSLQEQKLAIIASYNRKIAEAQTEGERKALLAEKKEALTGIDMKSLQDELQLDKVFGDLDAVGTKALKGLQQALEEFIQTNKNLAPDQIKDLAEALERIKEEVKDRSPFASLREAIHNLTEAQRKYNQALREGTAEEQKAAQSERQKALNEATKAKNAALDEINKYVEAAGSITGSLEDMGVTIPESIKGAMEGLDGVVDGLSSIDLTKPLSIITGGFKAIAGVVKIGTSLFGSENREWEKLSAQYASLSKIWDDLIDKKKEYISMHYGDDVSKATEEVKKLYKAEIEGIKSLARARLDYRKKGDHSVGYDMWKGRKEHDGYAWKDIANDVAQTIGAEFDGMEDLIGLTQEQWEALVKRYPEYVANLDQDFLNYLNEIRGKEEAIKEALDNETERWTGFTGDSFADNFFDELTDMDKAASDFATDFEGYLMKAVINATLAKNYKERLEGVVTQWQEAMKDGLTQEEADSLRDLYQGIVNEAIAERDKLAETIGYDTNLQEREGAKKGIATASQDSVDELNARVTTMQGHTFSISENTQSLLTAVNLILPSVLHIETHTEAISGELKRMRTDLHDMKSAIGDMSLKGVKIK